MAYVRYTASFNSLSQPWLIARLFAAGSNLQLNRTDYAYTGVQLDIDGIFTGLDAGQVYDVRFYESPDAVVLTALPLKLTVEAVGTAFSGQEIHLVTGRGLVTGDPAIGDNTILLNALKDKDFLVFRGGVHQNADTVDSNRKINILQTGTQGGFETSDPTNTFLNGEEFLILIDSSNTGTASGLGNICANGEVVLTEDTVLDITHQDKFLTLNPSDTGKLITLWPTNDVQNFKVHKFQNINAVEGISFLGPIRQAGVGVSSLTIPQGAKGEVIRVGSAYVIWYTTT